MSQDFIEKPLDNQPKKKNPFIRILKLIIWIIVITFIIIYFKYSSFKTEALIQKDTKITIKKGDTIENLAEKLSLNKIFLKYYLKNNNNDFELLFGDFNIKEGSNIEQVIESLKTPIVVDEVNITLLEGWNIYDIDDYLAKKGYINKEDYINYVNNLEKIEKLTEFFPFIKGLTTLEGFLYPDTYKINPNNIKINNLVISQLENFENKAYKTILTQYDNKKIEEIINLASIVEKEEKNPLNKTTVAGILKKRLNEGWMIGADITVCYPHKLTSEECKMVVSKYIGEISEYNTRTKVGLPKTPIGNPTFETIEATINSKETPYYYYLHDIKTGKIYYGKNNSEHEENKKYLR